MTPTTTAHARSRRTFLAFTPLSLASLLLFGCSAATIVTDIQVVVGIVTAAAPIIAVFAGPGAAIITAYLMAVTTGLTCVLVVAQMPGVTVGQITAAVASCLAMAVEPVLPPGVPQAILAIVNEVATAVLNFITKWGKGSATFKKGVIADTPLKLHQSDLDKLKAMQEQLNTAHKTLTQKPIN